jgi:glyoxylase-like metal-dependent hydrolase (beta-lactamase superfamily II)
LEVATIGDIQRGVTRTNWLTPGAFEVAPHVYRIPLPLPNDNLKAVNVYAVTGGDGVVIIDSGWAIDEGRDALATGLGLLGYSLVDIAHFLVTHVHRDHYTQAVRLRQAYGMKVSLGEGEQLSLEAAMRQGSNHMATQVRYMRALGATKLADQLAAVTEFPEPDVWELPDEWLNGNSSIDANGRALDVIPTPGHTHGHVVFHDVVDALLFAGDHVLPTITPSIGFEAVLFPNPLGDYLGSLEAVRRLPDAMLLPAHGPVGPSVHQRIDELLDHHSVRLEQTAAAVASGADTPYEVAGTLLWTRHERTLSDLNPFNQMLAIAETNAHLRLLQAQDKVTEMIAEGVHHYQLR